MVVREVVLGPSGDRDSRHVLKPDLPGITTTLSGSLRLSIQSKSFSFHLLVFSEQKKGKPAPLVGMNLRC